MLSWTKLCIAISIITLIEHTSLKNQLRLMNHNLTVLLRSSLRKEAGDLKPLLTEPDDTGKPTLLFLMWNLMGNKTTEPHDNVYALLGVAQDIDVQSFKIDYAKPFCDVFAYITRYFIHQYSDLTVLKLVSVEPYHRLPYNRPRQGPRCLPSWVPDYRDDDSDINDLRRYHGTQAVEHGRERHFNATGASKVAMSSENNLLFSCQGVAIGQILRLTEPAWNLTDMAIICDEVLAGGAWSRLARECAVNGLYPPTQEPVELAYARTRIDDFLPGEGNAELRRIRRTPVSHFTEPSPRKSVLAEGGRFYSQQGGIPSPVDLSPKALASICLPQSPPTPPLVFLITQQPRIGRLSSLDR